MPEAPNLSLQRPSRKTPALWPSCIPHNGFLPSRLTTTELWIWLDFNHATASFKAFCCAIKKIEKSRPIRFLQGWESSRGRPVCVWGGKWSMFGRRNHAGYGSVNVHGLFRLQRTEMIWLRREKNGLCYVFWIENGSVLDLWWGGDVQRAAEWLSLRLPIRSVNKPPGPVWWILSWCLIICNVNTSPLPDHALLWNSDQSLDESFLCNLSFVKKKKHLPEV